MRRSLVNSLLLAVVVLTLFATCSDRNKGRVLPSAKLEAVLYDYHLAQVMIQELPSSQRYKKDLYLDYVYDKHGVTKAEVDSTLVYYARYPEGLSEIYERLSQRVERDLLRFAEEDRPVEVREAFSVVGDSANLWYDLNFLEMNPSPLKGNRYTFTIPTDTNFKALDRIVWEGEVLFLGGETDTLHRYLHLELRLAYMNDSVRSADTLLYTSGKFFIGVSDSAVVRSVNGTAYFKSTSGDDRVLLLSPSLMRYRHHPDSLTYDTFSIK